MECPHLSENIKIQSSILSDKAELTKDPACAVCSTTQSLWLCLHCGIVHCGRYINGHAMEHAKQLNDHIVCMDCHSLSVFCYICDDFVVNDTSNNNLDRLRQTWQSRMENMPEESLVQEKRRSLRPRSRKRQYSPENSNSSSENMSTFTNSKRRNSNSFAKHTKQEKKVLGLRNLGNTCFMNAVLQCLRHIPHFSLYFKGLPSLEGAKCEKESVRGSIKVYQSRSIRELSDAIMAEELRKVLISLIDHQGTIKGKGAISPESLFMVIWKVVPRFRGYQQQDAHEFLRYMLDRLHTELLTLLPDNPYFSLGQKERNSIVTSVFGGTLQSEVTCLNCRSESKKHDPFLDLSLDIPDKQKRSKDSADDTSPPCTVLDCLTSFIEIEELAETELYYCNACKSKQRSTKRFWILRLPNVLCLHLKRFRWVNSSRTKLDTNIKFPVTALDMSKFVLNDVDDRTSITNLYDLAAVIVHHGSGAGCGHYTVFAINEGQWFHFNDSSVKPTEISVVSKCKPYILFYVKREFGLPVVQS
uniref:Ubiquitin carboxyl-terminal hydrolase n=1 Tax=Clastoptera arizonana TaxID=38151 RepID=A0A1B6CBZ9_9HEMI